MHTIQISFDIYNINNVYTIKLNNKLRKKRSGVHIYPLMKVNRFRGKVMVDFVVYFGVQNTVKSN